MQSERVRIRLEEEDVQTAGDLQELDKDWASFFPFITKTHQSQLRVQGFRALGP